ncbi:MAG: transposase, partial [Sedimentisphaerales bacterium]|nr:transposase [Sedimentisphaerales bacterium]
AYRFGSNKFATPELHAINRAAYWDYQRNKIYVRSSKQLKRISKRHCNRKSRRLPVNKIIECGAPSNCPKCKSRNITTYRKETKTVYDLKFTHTGIKRWIVRFLFRRYACNMCGNTFLSKKRSWTRSKYGSALLSYTIYQIIELCHPQATVEKNLNELFALNIPTGSISRLKTRASQFYRYTYETLIKNISNGLLIHADETKLNIKNNSVYVWILTNLEEVVYIYSTTREADMIQKLLKNFTGILVSDFYAGYNSINCLQQKCLIHLIRDLNDDLFKEPFNEELKELVWQFGLMLKPMIETVDRYGLKKRYLRKHNKDVSHFYKMLAKSNYESEIANKYKKRFDKNRYKLFTFLNYDGVPWNNNNAEHAIKAFARLRKIVRGLTSEKGIQEYLILLSICETCKYKGISFLSFLRSGQRDIDEFINNRHSVES